MSAIAVCSGKGSPGATFVAVNLAVAMARTRERVMLIDLDPAGGDIAAYLGLGPKKGLYPLLQMERSLPDLAVIEREAEERLGVFAVGGFPVEATPESRVALPALLLRLRGYPGDVVADIGRVGEASAATASHADLVVLVVRPDLVSVLGAERALRALNQAGVARDKVRIFVSGAERRRPGDIAEVATALKVEVVGSIPFARKAARRSLVQQAPIAKGHLLKAFGELASTILGSETPDAAPASADLIGVPA